jgi:hypothetical protein
MHTAKFVTDMLPYIRSSQTIFIQASLKIKINIPRLY